MCVFGTVHKACVYTWICTSCASVYEYDVYIHAQAMVIYIQLRFLHTSMRILYVTTCRFVCDGIVFLQRVFEENRNAELVDIQHLEK